MGLIKFSIITTMLVGLSAILVQQYSPKTIDTFLSRPEVQSFTVKANEYIKAAEKQIKDKGYPVWVKVSTTMEPYIEQMKEKLENLIGVSEEETSKTESSGKKSKKSSGDKVFTVEELKQYDGKPGSKGLYLAFLGQVFDVKKGEKFYGPGGGYEFFAGQTLFLQQALVIIILSLQ